MTTGLDTGTYEVLRDRLAAQAAELARRAEALNTRRTEEFGSTRLELTGTGRLTTEHPATPSDIVAVGDALLFGRQTSLGVTRETAVADVLALYDRHDLRRLPEDAVPGLLDDPEFVREFTALHRYYRQARLLQLRRVDGKLLAVFRTGEKADDIRVLRWALTDDGRTATFLDAHGERDHVFPPPYDFDWIGTGREDLVPGRHPHVRIQDGLYVDTLGGTLTVKVEDNTETPEGIYSEPVDEPLQSPADAEIAYARVGALVLLRVQPYKEDAHRYLVFNTLTKGVVRLDGIGLSCRRLPEEQGIVFPGGYCLATGECKTFEIVTAGLELERIVRSPNGEDVLFAYRARGSGRSLLLPYNMIRKEVAAPLPGRGWALFEDGMSVV
ncbi:DNA repair ATPase, partial [Streptomyces sp. MBT62]|uniref:DNA repair ATPase n=1 Tax=Streptomyces sp. MBT62 TaxID=2800410 RepID=UPI00190DABD9